MKVSPELSWSLEIGSGIFWTLVYLLIIRLGFRDKTYGMPITALCANISWEFIFSFMNAFKTSTIAQRQSVRSRREQSDDRSPNDRRQWPLATSGYIECRRRYFAGPREVR
jgi:hypothetical protein